MLIFGKALRNSLICSSVSGTRSLMTNQVKVQVKQGVVVGCTESLKSGKKYKYFKGIPYAQPPLGKLRFLSPLPLERFEPTELNCFEHRDKSLQRDAVTKEVVGSENCLFLNVYAPDVNCDVDGSNKALPVMVWIHGGGFHTGGNSDLRLPLGLLENNVIVVTVSYRLGVLGFLSCPEEGIWGNAGLKDQRLALQWVQDNITHFNGDKDNVTIFGESSGGSSVHLHMYAKHANELFHKAIMQSGTANMEWVFQVNPRYKTQRIADLLGCKSHNTRDIIDFMQSAPSLDILSNMLKVLIEDEIRIGLPFPFKPVIEDGLSPDAFVDYSVEKALRQRNAVHMPVIMGFNSAEAITMLSKPLSKIMEIDNDLGRYIPRNIKLTVNERESLVQNMRELYLNGRRLTADLANELVNLLSDYLFNFSMLKSAELHSRYQLSSPLYFYYFEYVGQNNLYKRLFQMEHLNGACHADELCYLFQTNETKYDADNSDARITRKMCSYWANFAHCGNPIDKSSQNPVVWNPVKPHEDDAALFVLDYLAINEEMEMRQNLDEKRFQFWDGIYKRYDSTDFSLSSL